MDKEINMLIGTQLDLISFGAVLKGISLLYWLLLIAALTWVNWKVQGRRKKTLSIIAVLAIMVVPMVPYGIAKYQANVRLNIPKARLSRAQAHFEMLCKQAGETIHKTVENVDGIVWMKWRPTEINFDDQFKLDDPYGTDCYGEECIKRLLRVSKGAELNPDEAKQHATGYRFVETIDPRDGGRYRYTGVIKSKAKRTPDQIAQYKKNRGVDPGVDVYGFLLEREPIPGFTARYGVTWDDISTHEDREQWIAGGSLKVIDLQNNEVIAERIGYMLDSGQGSKAGFRKPWPWTKSSTMPCPPNSERTWTFAFKIAQPTKTEK
jgi:hypothetical protein